jgi:hypothetical protein
MLQQSLAEAPSPYNADDDGCTPKRTESIRVSQAIDERVLLLVGANGEPQTQGNRVIFDNLTGGTCHTTEKNQRGSLARNRGVGSTPPLFLEIYLL